MGAAQENVKCEADFHMTHACWCQFLSSGSIIWLDTGAQMEYVWKNSLSNCQALIWDKKN